MRLRATDQVSISAVKSDNLRPGEEFEVSAEQAAEILHRLPGAVERVDGMKAAGAAPANKSLSAAPANKGSRRGKRASA